MAKKKLGKGLGAIISTSPTPIEDMEAGLSNNKDRIVELEIETIIPNPDQPRTHFDELDLNGLSESIKSVGLIQPIIVRKVDEKYVVIAGERRLRASKMAGFSIIRAIIVEASEEENLTLALIENIQRANLDPIEEARAYKALINRFKLKQQEVAAKVGKERTTVSNSLRLLNLPDDIQNALSDGAISVGHAKVLLSLTDEAKQLTLCMKVIEEELSVRALEKLINGNVSETPKEEIAPKPKDPHLKQMEDRLVSILGTKVEIKHSGSRGRIEISYYSLDDFERIVEIFK